MSFAQQNFTEMEIYFFLVACCFLILWELVVWLIWPYWQHDLCQGIVQAMPTRSLRHSPLLVFHLLGDSSEGHVEELAEFSVAVFQFLPFLAAMSDLNIKKRYSLTFLRHGVKIPLLQMLLIQILISQWIFRDSRGQFHSSFKISPNGVKSDLRKLQNRVLNLSILPIHKGRILPFQRINN